jgi:hypothetical protein
MALPGPKLLKKELPGSNRKDCQERTRDCPGLKLLPCVIGHTHWKVSAAEELHQERNTVGAGVMMCPSLQNRWNDD